MKKINTLITHYTMIKIFLAFLLLLNISVVSQEDSILVNKMSDNFIEIKTLKYKLFHDTSYLDTNLHFATYAYKSLVPEGPVIKNGTVIIKDRNDNILAINYYRDSTRVIEEIYRNNFLFRQYISNLNDSIVIDKYFFNTSGKIKSLVIMINSVLTEVDYSEDGKIEYFNERK